MEYTELVYIVGALCLFWWGAMKSLLERKRTFNNRCSLVTIASGYKNRDEELPPDVIDCEWSLIEELSELKTHHMINLMVFALVAIYFMSGWLASLIVWLFL